MKYKIGDILKIKNSNIETMITRIDKGNNTYCFSNCWEPEHYLDENYELLTPHEDEPLIKDEKIRKVVRAWAETLGENMIIFHRYLQGFSFDDGNACSIINFDGFEFNLADGKCYSINELCGEEE